MARDPETIRRALDELVQPDARNRLLALGLARGMIWRNGKVPIDGPNFPDSLTADLLDFGYGVLALALELRDANRQRSIAEQLPTDDALTVAAEAIEAAIRRGDPSDRDRGRHLVVCSAAMHLAGFAARSYSLLPTEVLDKNLASPERALALLLRRDLVRLREYVSGWLSDPSATDDAVSLQLLDEESSFGPDDAAFVVLAARYYRALGSVETSITYGDSGVYEAAIIALRDVINDAGSLGNIPIWWVATLTKHLARDLWDQSLHVRLPDGPRDDLPSAWTELRRDFIAVMGARTPPQIDLWPSQLAAAERATNPRDNLVIALPTSAGKTRIAELCILRALADGKRTIYVTPLRALSAQVERVLGRTFIPLGATVTSLYGAIGETSLDAQALRSAQIVVATPEKLDFALRQDPNVLDDVALVVFDEGHMIGLGSREIRYEVLIQRLLRRGDAAARRIVCLSAMFNDDDPFFRDFFNWLRRDEPGDSLGIRWRPTRQLLATLDWNERIGAARLSFIGGEAPFVPKFVDSQGPKGRRKRSFPSNEMEFCIASADAFAQDGHSILVYSPQRSQIEPLVRDFAKFSAQGYLIHLQEPDPACLTAAQAIGREWLGDTHPAMMGLARGVGMHHGALPRPFLAAVEKLLDERRLSVVVASPTLAQGIDLACSVLVFRSLTRFDAGENRQVPISPAEFANVVGRAGRAFVDLDGIAVLPTFESKARLERHNVFENLLTQSRGERLISGLARLVREIIQRLSDRLGIDVDSLSEYVANNQELWQDPRLSHGDDIDDDDQGTRSLSEFIADLDVALLSLLDPLGIEVDALPAALDEVLRSSLWKRTLSHFSEISLQRQREILVSRAVWVWRTTTEAQRKACFNAGLGKESGAFLYEHLEELLEKLVAFQAAVSKGDSASAADSAIAFAESVMAEPFFGRRALPADWRLVLGSWVQGIAFADILNGRQVRDMQRTQAFIQDGVIFKLVWAAEAVRVQAVTAENPMVEHLGEGPALSLTYGVPSIPAALLCQTGFSSRVGALFATKRLSATFDDVDGMRSWIRQNNAILSRVDFWESIDEHLLWSSAFAQRSDLPRRWRREDFLLPAQWSYEMPSEGTPIRVISRQGRSARLCGTDLVPLGHLELPFNPHDASLKGEVAHAGQVRVSYFGPV